MTPALLAMALLAVAGCGNKDSLKPDIRQTEDRGAIEKLIASSPEFALSFDDDGELVAETLSPTGSSGTQAAQDSMASLPVHWGRWRRPPNHPPVRTINYLIPPDSNRALVQVNVKFDGWFFVDRTDDGLRNPGKKPLRDQKTRYGLFRKVWYRSDSTSSDSIFGWRLIAVSSGEFTMIDPARQTVTIHSVMLNGERTQLTLTNPGTLFYLNRSVNLLPVFRTGETVKVEAAVSNTDEGLHPPTFVFLHAPTTNRLVPGPFDWNRIRMVDDGTSGDAKAGDGIFTAMWNVRTWGHNHIAVDVLNSRCLQNESRDDYNSTTWAIPFESYVTIEGPLATP